MAKHSCYSLKISGKVQGVWYRKSTQIQAQALGLTGWVQNEVDGSVTCVAEGPEADLEALVTWCRHGPPHAKVFEINTESIAPVGAKSFEVRR